MQGMKTFHLSFIYSSALLKPRQREMEPAVDGLHIILRQYYYFQGNFKIHSFWIVLVYVITWGIDGASDY